MTCPVKRPGRIVSIDSPSVDSSRDNDTCSFSNSRTVVPGQIGAIILVDDQVVGVERVPSHSYWRSVWPSLVRECYGSLAIRVAQLKGDSATAPASRTPLPDDVSSLDELDSLIAEIARQEDERTKANAAHSAVQRLVVAGTGKHGNSQTGAHAAASAYAEDVRHAAEGTSQQCAYTSTNSADTVEC